MLYFTSSSIRSFWVSALLRRSVTGPRRRSIPACAGEPSTHPVRIAQGAVYPRVCGGTNNYGTILHETEGLSPRVRGNRQEGVDVPPSPRSIPACAGEPSPQSPWPPLRGVYPRVCGGTATLSPVRRVARGLSRVCGGTDIRLRRDPSGMGLSPRVRGNRPRRTHLHPKHGSIPACAGEPVRMWTRCGLSWVYPRVCGGTAIKRPTGTGNWGLSPRVRGNPVVPVFVCGWVWSIPACAGEPSHIPASRTFRPVYPRVCGGTVTSPNISLSAFGLSPRVRGTPWGFCQGGLWGEVPPMGWTLGLCGRVMVVRGYWGCLIMCAKSAGCTSSNGLGRVWVAGISERDVVRFQDVYRPC